MRRVVALLLVLLLLFVEETVVGAVSFALVSLVDTVVDRFVIDHGCGVGVVEGVFVRLWVHIAGWVAIWWRWRRRESRKWCLRLEIGVWGHGEWWWRRLGHVGALVHA